MESEDLNELEVLIDEEEEDGEVVVDGDGNRNRESSSISASLLHHEDVDEKELLQLLRFNEKQLFS